MVVAVKTNSENTDFVLIPAYEYLKEKFAEWEQLTSDVRTAEQAKDYLEQNPNVLQIEINGDRLEDYMKEENPLPIEWIRYESYGACFNYIYDRFDGNPILDITCPALVLDADNETLSVSDYLELNIADGIAFKKLDEISYGDLVNEAILGLHNRIETLNKKDGNSVYKVYPELLSTEEITMDKAREIAAELGAVIAERKKEKSVSIEK